MAAEIVRDPYEFQRRSRRLREGRGSLAFVPTMGALHEGHLELVRRAKEHAAAVSVSIFVNPTQFGPHEDFSRYPRTLAADVAKLEPLGVELVFAPEPSAIYPDGDRTRVTVSGLTAGLCGPFRPGHFEGVATIVAKLCILASADAAVFGKKDYQQLQVVRRMVRDLFIPVEIVAVPTQREADGLARSSRNAYLSPEERTRALALSRALAGAQVAFGAGERRAGKLRRAVHEIVASASDRIDYVSIADPDDLGILDDDSEAGARALCAIAAFIGKTRLIDNVVLGEDAPLPSAEGVDGGSQAE